MSRIEITKEELEARFVRRKDGKYVKQASSEMPKIVVPAAGEAITDACPIKKPFQKKRQPWMRLYDSKIEYLYAEYLKQLALAGEIIDWHREPDGIGLYQTATERWIRWFPDFLVETKTGVEYHEVKGNFVRKEDRIGIAKLDIGAGIMRIRKIPVIKVTRVKGEWKLERMN